MKKTGKIIIITGISLFVLVTGIITALITLTNPNQYKSIATQIVEQQTGAKLEVGDIRWGIIDGNLGLVINDVSLIMNPSINKVPLITAKSIDAGVSLIQLLHGQFNINNLVINGGNFNLYTDGTISNWKFARAPVKDTNQRNYIINLHGIKISNSVLSYTNTSKKLILNFININADLETTSNGSINYYTEANLLVIDKAKFELNKIIAGDFNFNFSDDIYNGSISTQIFSLQQLANSLGINKLPQWAKSNQLDLLALNGNFNGSAKNLNLSNISLTTPDSKINIKATINSFDPLEGFNSITVDQADVADYIPLKGYRLKIKDMISKGTFSEHNNKLVSEQNVDIANLVLYGYNLHSLSLKIATILSDPLKIISVPQTVIQIQNSIAAANNKGAKNLNLTSNLGHLSSHVNYSETMLETNQLLLSGPDLRASANGSIDTKNNYMSYQVNAQFMSAPNTLTGKIIYPATINGPIDNPQNSINWNSVSRQIAEDLGGSIINTGKNVGKATGSTMEKIGSKIKSWF